MILVCLLENAGIHVDVWYLLCYAAMTSTHDAWWILQKEGRNAFAERNIRMRMWIFRLNVPDLHGA